jgi:hypothetical protein
MREVVELPMLHPEKFVQLGIDPPKGVLCYGPPGMHVGLVALAVSKGGGQGHETVCEHWVAGQHLCAHLVNSVGAAAPQQVAATHSSSDRWVPTSARLFQQQVQWRHGWAVLTRPQLQC